MLSAHYACTHCDRSYEPPAGETPEQAFDTAWKAALLQTVRRNLEAHYAAAIEARERLHYQIFTAVYFPEREDQPTMDTLAEHFSITREQVKYAIERVRKRYERLLRQEIRDQVGPDVDVEEEIRKLVGSG